MASRDPRTVRPLHRAIALLVSGGLWLGHGSRAGAAAFLPGEASGGPEPVAASAEPAAGLANGLSFSNLTVAPIVYWGNAALDLRYRDEALAGTSDSEILSAIVNGASYIWQPWFAQIRGSVGVVGSLDHQHETGGAARNVNGIGDLDLSVFPTSRFPFNFYAGVGDSRATGDVTSFDYRTTRFRLSQSYQPLDRNERYSASFEQSTIRTDGRYSTSVEGDSTFSSSTDVLRVLRGAYTRNWVNQSLDAEASLSHNRTRETNWSRESSLDFANVRHVYDPRPSLNVSTMASVSRNAFDYPVPGGSSGDYASQGFTDTFGQLTSFATYRPQEGDPLYQPDRPLQVTANLRLFHRQTESNGVGSNGTGGSAALGVSYDATPALQLFASTQAAYVDETDATRSAFAQTVGVNYSPPPIPLGRFNYLWSTGLTGVYGTQSGGVTDDLAGAQAVFNHSLSRNLDAGAAGGFSFTFSQGFGARWATPDTEEWSMTNTVSTFWNAPGTRAGQGFVGLTASDGRRYGSRPGSFQLVNLQASVSQGLSRRSSWNGNLTLQATRSDETRSSAALDEPVFADPYNGKWRHAFGGSLAYAHDQIFAVPGLRFSSLLQANSYTYQRRELGDLDAPVEQVNWSFENRLEYYIGRLAVRLTARVADIENSGTGYQLFLRIERTFGRM